MTCGLTYKSFICNMADIALIWVVVLASIFSGAECATISTTGSTTTATASVTNLDLKCTYVLIANETATTLTWKKGSTSILTWTIPGTPAPVAPWVRTDHSTATTTGTVTIRLPLASVTKSSGGVYTCAVTSTGASAGTYTDPHSVTIHYKPEITLPSSASGIEASTVRVTCSADAKPAATFTWKKGSSQVETGSVLSMANIRRNQSGIYTCSASNTVGSSQKDVTVDVYHLDAPEMTLSSNTVAENNSISMICTASSNPPAIITIVGSSKSKSGTDRQNCTFIAGCLDTGTYQCSARNSKITTPKKTSQNLSVLCKPRNDTTVREETEFVKNLTESVVFKATLIALPKPVFQWTRRTSDTGEVIVISNEAGHFEITNTEKTSQLKVTIRTEDDYAEYSLKAENDQGETTLKYTLRSLTSPYSVATLDVANVTTDSITVMWSSSFNGGAKQEYLIQYLPMADSQQEAWTQKTARISDPGRKEIVYARISDIHPGRTYRVRVFSVNMFGQSEYSNVINVKTSDLPTQISYGIGIVIGIVIAIVIMAAVVGGFVLYRRKFKPLMKGNSKELDHENRAFSGRISESTVAGLYDGLEGERERPPTYDALDQEQPVYQNVEKKHNGSVAEPSTPEVYMNFDPSQTEPKRKFQSSPNLKKKNQRKIENNPKSEHRTDAYENSQLVTDKSLDLSSNNKQPYDGGVYANT